MTYLVLDLETVVDPSLPTPKSRNGEDHIPPPPFHQIVVLGAALLDNSCRLRRIWIVGEDKDGADRGADELTVLSALSSFLNETHAKRRALTVVSFNGRGFDMPVIVSRCLRHGLPLPWYYQQREARMRYCPQGHLDLMDFLADHGAAPYISLDIAARLIGMPGKMSGCGGDVAGLVERRELERVRAYCMGDVAQTAALFLRTQLLRGELSPGRYTAAMQGLLEVVRREPRLAPMLPLIDTDRLLNVPGATAVLPFHAAPPAKALPAPAGATRAA